jgi:hypothetical protein
MKLKRNVVLLATNDKAPIAQWNKGNKYLSLTTNTRNLEISEDETYQHLYITSDEEIKEGDWYYNNVRNEILQCVNKLELESLKAFPNYAKKIIATTDKSLLLPVISFKNWNGKTRNLPSPSDGFIKKFIEKWNAGTPITKVLVEYIKPVTPDADGFVEMIGFGKIHINNFPLLKVDKDNCITIRPVKERWTRGEVVQKIHEVLLATGVTIEATMIGIGTNSAHIQFNADDLEKWIELNL